jgi:tellurite resistance protein
MSLFAKFLSKMSAAKAQIVSGNAAKAAAGVGLYIAASGGISDDEFDKLRAMLKANPRFEGLDVDAIMADWEKVLKSSERMMRSDLMELLGKIRDPKEISDVIITALEVADAPDEEGKSDIDADERDRLNKVCAALGVSLSDYE